jgi:hypothetical protein
MGYYSDICKALGVMFISRLVDHKISSLVEFVESVQSEMDADVVEVVKVVEVVPFSYSLVREAP